MRSTRGGGRDWLDDLGYGMDRSWGVWGHPPQTQHILNPTLNPPHTHPKNSPNPTHPYPQNNPYPTDLSGGAGCERAPARAGAVTQLNLVTWRGRGLICRSMKGSCSSCSRGHGRGPRGVGYIFWFFSWFCVTVCPYRPQSSSSALIVHFNKIIKQ